MSREEALQSLREPPYAEGKVRDDVEYVRKKLGMSEADFKSIMDLPPKSIRDYPSYYPIFEKYTPLMRLAFKIALPWTPPVFKELEARRGKSQKNQERG
jgi:hypothetical protein